MKNYWVPQNIDNPNLREDIRKYFPQATSDQAIDKLLNNNNKKNMIIAILDKLEFIDHLFQIKEIMKGKLNIIPNIRNNVIGDQTFIAVKNKERIEFEGYDFAGIPHDIDALCQYLLISVIEMLAKNYNRRRLARGFKNTFADLSTDIKDRLVNTFKIVKKVEVGKINDADLNDWNQKTYDDKILGIATFLYETIRCNYTHEAGRTFLAVLPVERSLGIERETLVSSVSPHEDSLIPILKDIIKELIVDRFPI